MIDNSKVSTARDLINRSVGFGKNVADLGLGPELQKRIANSTRCTVVAFAESGGENKNLFHVGIGRREFNG
jgi:hypothetical protein